MSGVKGKKNTSKRQKLKVKHKIRKKVSQSNRKLKKEAKKAKAAGVDLRSAKKKSTKNAMHIPNLWPFKQEELIRQKQMVDRKEADRMKNAEQNRIQCQKDAKKKRAEQQSAPKRPVYKLQNTVDAADLLINVLDARDPLASRCTPNEDMAGKKSIIVLTKCDLVPKENVKNWLNYLRRKTGCPVITLTRREDSSKPFGFKNLVKMLESYEFRFVGVVGYPGVGKHTVESYLKLPSCQLPRKCKTQSASIFESDEIEQLSADLMLLRKPQAAVSPLPVLKRVLERTSSKEDLLIKLALPDFEDAETLLQNVMKECGCASPIDAVRQFLKRWNSVGHCTAVPSDDVSGAERDMELRHKNLSVDELMALYSEDAKEVDALHAWLEELKQRLEAQMEGNGAVDGGTLTTLGGMKEQFVDRRKEKKGDKKKEYDLSGKKSSSMSTVISVGKKGVQRVDLDRVLTMKPAVSEEGPDEAGGGKLLAGGPEPFNFGDRKNGNDMDFSDDEDEEMEGSDEAEVPELVDLEEELEEEDDVEMDDLELAEEEEEADEEDDDE